MVHLASLTNFATAPNAIALPKGFAKNISIRRDTNIYNYYIAALRSRFLDRTTANSRTIGGKKESKG